VDPLWTPSGARLQWVRSSGDATLHWLFLPGGPGLGSESLLLLLEILDLPGNLWRLDLPGDGSNTTPDNAASFAQWDSALLEAVGKFKPVVLAAHSTGGMYALSLPEIEEFLEGLVLLDSAPDAGWQDSFQEAQRRFPLAGLVALQAAYEKSPNNELLKAVTIASAPYLFAPFAVPAGVQMLRSLPFNVEACRWSADHFDPIYRARWVPRTIPTLILSGAEDLITPLRLFKESRRFHRPNITFKSIPRGGHFPWIENPQAVALAFEEYCAAAGFRGRASAT
jgi:pimeloyl-ACP methyl ester carboxylesterase